jgi:hypothetical protein
MATPQFRTRPDGTVYPLTPKKMGGGVIVLALVLAVLLADRSRHDSPASAPTTSGPDAPALVGVADAGQGQYAPAFGVLGLRVVARASGQASDCAARAHGQVRTFLLGTPCNAVDRTVLSLDDAAGNGMVISIAWVHLSSADTARRFTALDDAYGTGDVTPLNAAAVHLGAVRFTGQHYRSRCAGPVAVIAEAAPSAGHISGDTLDEAATIASTFPSP